MYEVGFRTPKSIIRKRPLELSDFFENYKACVEKRRFEAFGIPNEEECCQNAYFKEPLIKY
jgi:hypothetical protein